ncbi:MAG: hypothetical protein U0168_25210 [Nannocystaceae bacterium]
MSGPQLLIATHDATLRMDQRLEQLDGRAGALEHAAADRLQHDVDECLVDGLFAHGRQCNGLGRLVVGASA